jgi:TonB family protein
MPDSLPRMPSKGPLTTERRQNPRHPVRPTEYIEIGDSNGGIILDISEGGMAVASAQALVGRQTLRFRFQLPRSLETIETFGEINWIGETKKRAGVRFVDLPLAAREQIHKWIDAQISGPSDGEQKPNGSAVSSRLPQFSQAPHPEPSRQELVAKQTLFAAHGPNPSKNLNPFSSALSSPLDEPETEESEPEEEETAAAAKAQPFSERRIQNRFLPTVSTYVQLSDGNGGLMANLSKTGFCVRAAKMLEADHLPVVRFQLPNARDFVEASAWIIWKSPTKKTAGARFENLSAEAQFQIVQWIDSQPLPKSASIKNPTSKNSISLSPPVSSRSEQREGIPSLPKTPALVTGAPVTPPPLTLMSPDSVPMPTYISPLAISPDAQPSAPPANSGSPASPLAPSPAPSLVPLLATPLAKVPPIVPPGKPSPPSTEKTLAQVPPVNPAPLSAKPAAFASATVLPQPQKPPVSPLPISLGKAASANPAANLAPVAPRMVPPPSSIVPGKPLGVGPLPDTSRGLKNPGTQLTASRPPTTKFLPATPGIAPTLNEPDWSIAPKRPTGNWKIAAMIVVIVGILFGAAALLRSKKSVTPASQETAQNSSVAATAPAVTPSSNQDTNSSASNQPPTSPTASLSNADSSREFHDTPRNAPPNSSSKSDEQFVDEPRPARSQPQISSTPSQNNASRPASGQPSSPGATQPGTPHPQNPSTEEGSGFPTVNRQMQNASTLVSSNANGEAASQPDSSSAPPAPSASRNQQPDANLASAAGVTQNSSTSRAAPASENNSPRPSTSINPSPAATAVPAASTSATISDPVPTVSVFSRFRAIRTTSDAARPAGSDLQIGRLKNGPAPPYPVEAQRQQIQGTVELEVLVGADGNILTVHLVKGPPELASVAMGTVRSWQYGPTTLGGHPVETDQSIYFTFKLTK